jgi:hypothetical protein
VKEQPTQVEATVQSLALSKWLSRKTAALNLTATNIEATVGKGNAISLEQVAQLEDLLIEIGTEVVNYREQHFATPQSRAAGAVTRQERRAAERQARKRTRS